MSGAAAPLLLSSEAMAQSRQAPSHTPATGFAPLKHVRTDLLEISYAEDDPSDGQVVLLLHGWPYDIFSYTEASRLVAQTGYRVIMPYLRGYGATFERSAVALDNPDHVAITIQYGTDDHNGR